MKTQLMTAVLLLATTLLTAQTENKEAKETKVRIKKVENINGVEKITDTTYVVKDGSLPAITKGNLSIEEIRPMLVISDEDDDVTVVGKDKAPGSPSQLKKNQVVIVTGDTHGGTISVEKKAALDEQMKSALKEAGIDEGSINDKDILLINTNATQEEKEGSKKTRIVIVRTAKITTASNEDCKTLGKQTGGIDNQLTVENMSFYPNPSTGRFTLDFNLNGKGDTEVTVMNIEGRAVYSETLKGFSGNYKKEIDISTNPKGVYFVKVKQGDHAQLKKIVME